MKQKMAFILITGLGATILPSCKYTPPEAGSNNTSFVEEYVEGLEEQHFTSALAAYQFGEQFFSQSSYYETIQFGTAVAMGRPAYSLTKRFKSSSTNNFLYEASNLSGAILGIDPSFALKTYRQLNEETIYYGRVNGKEGPNAAKEDSNYSSESYKGATADFTGLPIKTKANIEELKRDVTAFDPEKLIVYIINSSTIKEVISFNKNTAGYTYTFTFSLKEEAMADYRKQINFYSGQAFSSFNPLELKHGLLIDFKMDKYGRILQMDVNENYRVTALGGIKTTVTNKVVQYLSYSKHPRIDFLDETVFKGPSITY